MINNNLYKDSIYDYILAGLAILISIILIYYFYFYSLRENTIIPKAEIYNNNTMRYSLDLQKNQVINNKGMQIEINSGKIRVRHSDCPQQTCVHRGWISRPNQRIICIPNKTIIEISGHNKKNQFDYEVK